MENGKEAVYTSPSFSTYSSDKLAEIVVKVRSEKSGDDREDEADFEFSLVRQETELSADEFLYDGQLGPIFPVFNRDILLSDAGGRGADGGDDRLASSIQLPMSKLSLGDRNGDGPPSCSSSEVDDLESSIPSGSYCVWRPKLPDFPSPIRCKKSKSTGSASKRWKFRDLLRRSNSEGKESLVFLTPRKSEEREKSPTEIPRKSNSKGKGTVSGSGAGSSAAAAARSAHEALYVRNRNMNETHKKKSFLPYRQDLVGFFVNVNALGKGFPHM